MSENFKESDSNLLNHQMPSHFFYTDFTNEWKEIIFEDLLHPTLREYEKAAYFIFKGCFASNPKKPYLFHFGKDSFKKTFFPLFDITKFERNQIVKVKLLVRKEGTKLILMKEITELLNEANEEQIE